MIPNDITETILRARTQAEALGDLYELYYERIYRFCRHRLFTGEAAEEVTSTVFLQVADGIRRFTGRSEEDFRCWLYAIAMNHANAYIRTVSRRKRLLAEVVRQMSANHEISDYRDESDWPRVYQAILKLKPKQQSLITLRFFEKMSFEDIGKILNTSPAALRVMLHRILKKLRGDLQADLNGGDRYV